MFFNIRSSFPLFRRIRAAPRRATPRRSKCRSYITADINYYGRRDYSLIFIGKPVFKNGPRISMEIDEFWQRYMNANFSSIFNRSTLTVLPDPRFPEIFKFSNGSYRRISQRSIVHEIEQLFRRVKV